MAKRVLPHEDIVREQSHVFQHALFVRGFLFAARDIGADHPFEIFYVKFHPFIRPGFAISGVWMEMLPAKVSATAPSI